MVRSKKERRERERWWGVVNYSGKSGYVHGFYPEEEKRDRRELEGTKAELLGPFFTVAEAQRALENRLIERGKNGRQ